MKRFNLVLMGKWIIETDQSFSVVENEDFEDLWNLLKKDITLSSLRTVMRRLEELKVSPNPGSYGDTTSLASAGHSL
jgi:hypothetical protein